MFSIQQTDYFQCKLDIKSSETFCFSYHLKVVIINGVFDMALSYASVLIWYYFPLPLSPFPFPLSIYLSIYLSLYLQQPLCHGLWLALQSSWNTHPLCIHVTNSVTSSGLGSNLLYQETSLNKGTPPSILTFFPPFFRRFITILQVSKARAWPIIGTLFEWMFKILKF